MAKYYKIFGSIKYIFDGDSQVIIKVTKETKDIIYGLKTNMHGNHSPYSMNECQIPITNGKKIVIIKKNIEGWEEL